MFSTFEVSRRSSSKSSVTLEHPLNMPSRVVQSDVSSFDGSIGSDRRTGIFPSESSLLRLVGAVMCDQAETWSGSRYFSERKMAEMHDAAFRMGAAGEHDWAELEKAARKMIESSLELADSVEAA